MAGDTSSVSEPESDVSWDFSLNTFYFSRNINNNISLTHRERAQVEFFQAY